MHHYLRIAAATRLTLPSDHRVPLAPAAVHLVQIPSGADGPASGNSIAIRVPPDSEREAETVPPCASTIACTMAKPRPAPPDDRDRDGSAR